MNGVVLIPIRLWHKRGMPQDQFDADRDRARVAEPLDTPALQRLALNYVARYATTSGKLAIYLRRKVRERGWSEPDYPETRIEAIVSNCADRGYLNDARYAETRADALARRGYGPGRVRLVLKTSGLAGETLTAVLADQSADESSQWAAVRAFARRKRIVPGCGALLDGQARARLFAAFVRAGHDPRLIARFLGGDVPETDFADR